MASFPLAKYLLALFPTPFSVCVPISCVFTLSSSSSVIRCAFLLRFPPVLFLPLSPAGAKFSTEQRNMERSIKRRDGAVEVWRGGLKVTRYLITDKRTKVLFKSTYSNLRYTFWNCGRYQTKKSSVMWRLCFFPPSAGIHSGTVHPCGARGTKQASRAFPPGWSAANRQTNTPGVKTRSRKGGKAGRVRLHGDQQWGSILRRACGSYRCSVCSMGSPRRGFTCPCLNGCLWFINPFCFHPPPITVFNYLFQEQMQIQFCRAI